MGELLTFQSSQPLLRILNLCDAGVSVFPEVKEFLIMLIGIPSGISVGFVSYFNSGSFMRRTISLKRGSSRKGA